MVLTVTQLQAVWSPLRSNCTYFLGWCLVQDSYSVPRSALGSSCICLSSSGKLLFTSKSQQPFQPPSDTAVTKKEWRSESLVCWPMKHIWGQCWWHAERGFQPNENNSPWPDRSDHSMIILPSLQATQDLPGSALASARDLGFLLPSCEWPGVSSCSFSAPAIGDQMASWEDPACFVGKAPRELFWLHCCWWCCSQRTRSTRTMVLLCQCLHSELYLPWDKTDHTLDGRIC